MANLVEAREFGTVMFLTSIGLSKRALANVDLERANGIQFLPQGLDVLIHCISK
jgi:hypothetical protein